MTIFLITHSKNHFRSQPVVLVYRTCPPESTVEILKNEMESDRAVIHRCLYCLSAIRISVQPVTIYHHSAIIRAVICGIRFTVAMTWQKMKIEMTDTIVHRYFVGSKCGYHRVSQELFFPSSSCGTLPLIYPLLLFRTLRSATRAFQQSSSQYTATVPVVKIFK